MASHYAVLGVVPEVTPKTLKRAYKKLAMQQHPDRRRRAKAKRRLITEKKRVATIDDIDDIDDEGVGENACPNRASTGATRSPHQRGAVRKDFETARRPRLGSTTRCPASRRWPRRTRFSLTR